MSSSLSLIRPIALPPLGWQYFEVEVVELGMSGLFWLGWSPGPQQATATATPSSLGTTPRQSTAAAQAVPSPAAPQPLGWLQYPTASVPPLGSMPMRASGSFTSGGGSGAYNSGGFSSSRGGGSCSSLLSSSYAICSQDGRKMQPGGRDSAPYLPKLMKGDVVGMLFNRACRTISVTHNRKFVSVAFSGVADGGGDGGARDGGGIENAWSGLSSGWGSAAGVGSPLHPATRRASLIQEAEGHLSSSPSASSPSLRQGWGVAAAGPSASAAAAGAMRPLCPVIGLKSGGAVLRFLTHGSEFFKNIDALLFRWVRGGGVW